MDSVTRTLLEQAIRSQFHCEAEHITKLGGGLSGTPIFRFSIGSEYWIARSWPCSHENRTKIANWSAVAFHLEQRVSELKPWFDHSPIPRPVLWNAAIFGDRLALQLGDHLWTLSRWVPGEPINSDVTYDLLLGYIKQLAGLHRLTREMQHYRARSTGMIDRQTQLIGIQNDLSEVAVLCSRHPLKHELAPFIIKCAERSRDWLPTINRLAKRECECHWIIRDLWRENLLVNSDKRWTHTVDVGASRYDWPALDFVRLVGSLLEPDSKERKYISWQNLLEAYNAVNPHSDMPEVNDLLTVHEVSTVISIVFWAKKWKEQKIAPEIVLKGTIRMKELLRTCMES